MEPVHSASSTALLHNSQALGILFPIAMEDNEHCAKRDHGFYRVPNHSDKLGEVWSNRSSTV